MKSTFLGLLMAFSFQLTAQNPDETAIKKLLDDTGNDYCELSFADIVKKYWHVDAKTRFLFTGKGGEHVSLSGEELLMVDTPPTKGYATSRKENYLMEIEGNTAYVTSDQIVTITETGKKLHYHEFRGLKKINGAWKVHISSIHEY